MSETFECGDNRGLVSYLYDECEPAERAAIAAHIAVCPACAAEVAALDSTRVQLSAWTPPETELGFVISRPAAQTVKAPGWWLARPMPAWAQVAAAVLIFGAGLSLGIVRGTMPDAAGTAALTPAAAGAAAVTARDLAALEQRLRSEIAQVRTAASAAPVAATAARPMTASEEAVIARVRTLIEESEQRQQRELALRMADIVRDFDTQRDIDLAQIQRSFGQIEGATTAEVREQRQLLNYLMRVSQGQ